MVRVEVYRKPDCRRCDEARAVLEGLRRELDFELVEVDVTQDAVLESRWIDELPAVLVDGWSASEGRVPAAAELRRPIEKALARAAGRGRSRPAQPVSPRTARIAGLAFAALALAAVASAVALQLRERDAAGARAAEERFGIDRASVQAPDFRHPAMDGRTLSLAELRGQVVVVNFWATWCPPCRDEMPSMLALGREMESQYPGRFRMVAISVDEGWEVVRSFFGGRAPAGATVTLDAEQATTRAYYCAARGACPESFKFPETYVVDRSGRLVAYMVGPRNWSDPAARRFLERLIDG
jgi:thiol-disulfide isomerase/thioredoxin/glutaredoxin